MTESKTEILVGGLVMAVAIGFLVFAGQTTGMTRGAEEYRLNASFRSIDGVSIGTDVRMAGVKIGRVTDISLDPETYRARTVFTVEQGIDVPEDSAVSISSEGLLGGNYVEIQPGGSPFYLAAGDEIEFTQSSIGLISLLTKFVSGESGASE